MFQPGINLRTYGILRSSDHQQILLIDEVVFGKRLIKFPGGGVEHMEGPGSALVREFREELGVEIEVGPLVYASPHFHRSFFRPQQLLALYWDVRLRSGTPASQIEDMKLLWRPLKEIQAQELTHELDREVLAHLQACPS